MSYVNLKTVFPTILFLSFFSFNVGIAKCQYEQVVEAEEFPVGVKLTWSTNYETANSKFIVERAGEDLDFTVIGEVSGSGNSEDLKDYNFLDIYAQDERLFYRLKQIDFDGTYSYTDVTKMNKELTNNLVVTRMSDIVTKENFTVTLNSNTNGDLSYKLNNWKGETFVADKSILVEGINEVSFDLTDFKPGIYKVHLQLGNERETLVIRRGEDELTKKPNVASKN